MAASSQEQAPDGRRHLRETPHNVRRLLQLIALRGEDEIRTRGTLIGYVSLANWWFQPLTHLSNPKLQLYQSGIAKIHIKNSFAIEVGLFQKELTASRITAKDPPSEVSRRRKPRAGFLRGMCRKHLPTRQEPRCRSCGLHRR